MRIRIKDIAPLVLDHQFEPIDLLTEVKEGLWEAILPKYGLYKLIRADGVDEEYITYDQSGIKVEKDGGGSIGESIVYPY